MVGGCWAAMLWYGGTEGAFLPALAGAYVHTRVFAGKQAN